MIAGAALGAAEATGDPFNQRVLIDGEFYHVVEIAPALGQQDIERFGLRLSPRKAVEDRASVASCVEAFADQGRDDGVADQLVDLGPGRHVDALGRFVEQEHRRLLGQPFAEQDLLLVTAAEDAERLVDGVARPDRKPLEPLLGRRGLRLST